MKKNKVKFPYERYQIITKWGDDTNDGLYVWSPKKTLQAAVDALVVNVENQNDIIHTRKTNTK